MSLNIVGSNFGVDNLGYSDQNQNNLLNTKSKAILYVFSPNSDNLKDVGARPFIYNFDENLYNNAKEIADLSQRGTIRSGAIINDLMDSSNLNNYMMPSYSPTVNIRTSLLSDRWRFILIFTESAAGLMLGNTLASSSPSNKIRRINTGYFEDEPYNTTTGFGHSKTLNPNCFMVITHKTKIGLGTEHGAYGSKTNLTTFSTEDIIHSSLSKELSSPTTGYGNHNQGLFLLTPDNCLNSIDSNDDGYSLVMPGPHSEISNDDGANVVNDVLSQPAQHVAQIFKGIIRYQEDASHRRRLNTHRNNSMFNDEFLDESHQRMKLSRYMSLPRSSKQNMFDLDLDSRISTVDLDAMVNGDLEIISWPDIRPMFYETADQMDTTVTNQYSFLIASVVCPIMNSAGLNEMSFEFQIAQRHGHIHTDFITHHAGATWQVPSADLASMAKAVELELTYGIFDTIFKSKGDFHVAVKANSTGKTFIRLSLVGQGYVNPVDFEIPSFMGGIITPLLGDAASHATATESIETLYNIATGTEPIVNAFTDEDRSYADYANSINFNNDDIEHYSASHTDFEDDTYD